MEKPEDATAAKAPLLRVEVAYALPERQVILAMTVKQGCTALDAVRQSGIAGQFPGIDPASADMGIFSKNLDGKTLPLPGDYVLKAGDRVEIYRPLLADPNAARLQRAARAVGSIKRNIKGRNGGETGQSRE